MVQKSVQESTRVCKSVKKYKSARECNRVQEHRGSKSVRVFKKDVLLPNNPNYHNHPWIPTP